MHASSSPAEDQLVEIACRGGRPWEEIVHHHLAEGILRRLAVSAAADQFVLRGGFVTRLYVRPVVRTSNDLDFLGVGSSAVDDVAECFRSIIAEEPAGEGVEGHDGIRFDLRDFRARPIWRRSKFPGVRLFIRMGLGFPDRDFQIDLAFGEPLVPGPVQMDYPLLISPSPARVWMVRAENVLARKLQALAEARERRWRAKDLYDLWLHSRRPEISQVDLAAAIGASFTSRSCSLNRAHELFSPISWWGEKSASARWLWFCEKKRAKNGGWPDDFPVDLPENVEDVAQDVAAKIQPAMDQLPR